MSLKKISGQNEAKTSGIFSVSVRNRKQSAHPTWVRRFRSNLFFGSKRNENERHFPSFGLEPKTYFLAERGGGQGLVSHLYQDSVTPFSKYPVTRQICGGLCIELSNVLTFPNIS